MRIRKTERRQGARTRRARRQPYTAPSIERIFAQLDQLRRLAFDQLKRENPQSITAGREHKGLIFGGLIADGFLIVEAERKNLVESFGRVLMEQARSLGVGDRVMRHSASLTELGRLVNGRGFGRN